MEYASNAKGNAALTTGIIGTALGGIAAAGGVGGLLGIGPRPPMDPQDRPVTRYELSLVREAQDLKSENAMLRANSYTDNVAAGLQRQIDGQAAVNAAVTATMDNQQRQITDILSITRRYVPNDNIAPGWGRANVQAAPPVPPYFWPWPPFPYPGGPGPFPVPPASDTTTSTSTTTNGG